MGTPLRDSASATEECKSRAASLATSRRDFGAEPFFRLSKLGREIRTEVVGFEHLPDLEHRFPTSRLGTALQPLDRLLLRLDLPDPEAGDQLLRLREWPINDGRL